MAHIHRVERDTVFITETTLRELLQAMKEAKEVGYLPHVLVSTPNSHLGRDADFLIKLEQEPQSQESLRYEWQRGNAGLGIEYR